MYALGEYLTTSMSNFLKTENENLRKKTEMEKIKKRANV